MSNSLDGFPDGRSLLRLFYYNKVEFHRFLRLKQVQNITTWTEYSEAACEANAICNQFDNLLINYPLNTEQKANHLCPHRHFESPAALLEVVIGYMRNESDAVMKVANVHDVSESPKAGLCANCIHKLLIKTRGLNDIYRRWMTPLKRFRFEFMNTNIIISDQPIFLKALLSPSNLQLLTRIFRLFFVSYLKETNLKALIHDNEQDIVDPLRFWRLPPIEREENKYPAFVITNNEINICHGFEHSICTLSATIVSLLPLLRSHHIKHLFIDHFELKNVIEILDSFLIQYIKLPHIRVLEKPSWNVFGSQEKHKREFKRWQLEIQRDSHLAEHWPFQYRNEPLWIGQEQNLTLDELYERLVEKKHPILQRILFIASSLYQHFYFGYLRFRKRFKKGQFTRKSSEYRLMMELKRKRKVMDGYMYDADPFGWLQGRKERTDSSPYWNLVHCVMHCVKANKYFRMERWQGLQCGGCNKAQGNFTERPFKVCGGCGLAFYCSRRCQKWDWVNRHRAVCAELSL